MQRKCGNSKRHVTSRSNRGGRAGGITTTLLLPCTETARAPVNTPFIPIKTQLYERTVITCTSFYTVSNQHQQQTISPTTTAVRRPVDLQDVLQISLHFADLVRRMSLFAIITILLYEEQLPVRSAWFVVVVVVVVVGSFRALGLLAIPASFCSIATTATTGSLKSLYTISNCRPYSTKCAAKYVELPDSSK